MLIGISGKMGAGKDIVANHLCYLLETRNNFRDNWSIDFFAYALKKRIADTWGLSEEQLDDRAFKETASPVPKKGTLSSYYTWRELLQLEGATMRDIYEHYWVVSAMNRSAGKNVIFKDVRYPNEADFIHNNDGIVIRIIRPDNPYFNPETAYHSSETAMDDYNEFDIIIINNGTKNDLYDACRSIANSIV